MLGRSQCSAGTRPTPLIQIKNSHEYCANTCLVPQSRQPLVAQRTLHLAVDYARRRDRGYPISQAAATLIACTPSAERMDWTSPAGLGLLNRYPCASVHPSIRRHSSCSVVSTPSAVVTISRLLPSPTTARMIARLS